MLTPLHHPLVEPFDIVVRRPVGLDCLVSFEGRRYSVPFHFVRQEGEVRGLENRVLFKWRHEVEGGYFRSPRGQSHRFSRCDRIGQVLFLGRRRQQALTYQRVRDSAKARCGQDQVPGRAGISAGLPRVRPSVHRV